MAEKKPKKSPKNPQRVSLGGDNGGDSKYTHVEFGASRSKADDMITIEIDLTNPEDLMRKMQMIDLTDEETDQLLAQALEINRKLKKQLSKQTKAGPAMTRSASFLVSAPASVPSSLPPLKPKSGSGRSSSHKSPTYDSHLSKRYSPPSAGNPKKQASRGTPSTQKSGSGKSK